METYRNLFFLAFTALTLVIFGCDPTGPDGDDDDDLFADSLDVSIEGVDLDINLQAHGFYFDAPGDNYSYGSILFTNFGDVDCDAVSYEVYTLTDMTFNQFLEDRAEEDASFAKFVVGLDLEDVVVGEPYDFGSHDFLANYGNWHADNNCYYEDQGCTESVFIEYGYSTLTMTQFDENGLAGTISHSSDDFFYWEAIWADTDDEPIREGSVEISGSFTAEFCDYTPE